VGDDGPECVPQRRNRDRAVVTRHCRDSIVQALAAPIFAGCNGWAVPAVATGASDADFPATS